MFPQAWGKCFLMRLNLKHVCEGKCYLIYKNPVRQHQVELEVMQQIQM